MFCYFIVVIIHVVIFAFISINLFFVTIVSEVNTAEKMTKSTIVVDSARGWWVVFASFMVHFIMDG